MSAVPAPIPARSASEGNPRTTGPAFGRTRLRRAPSRRGLTLIELLIVVGIMLAITAIAIPMLVPSQDERRRYEAGREVTGMFQGARAMAIESGRSVGVMLHRVDGLPGAVG